MSSIRLHPNYGLNPTISTCFLCGGDKNEIALLGSAYHGEAPKKMIINKEPCDTCKSYMAQGVLLICVKDGTDHENPYRLGHLAVIKEEAAKKIFNNLGNSRAAFVEESLWKELGLPTNQEEPA